MKDSKTITEQLGKAFDFKDVEWRVGSSFKKDGQLMGIALPYITNRSIQDRLDEVFGLDGWYNKFERWGENAQLCGITCKFGENWITKWDGCEDSDYESTKGGLSNSQKRAAVQFNIGRYIYKLETAFVKVEEKGKSKIIPKSEYTKLENFYNAQISKIYGTPAKAPLPYNNKPNNNQVQQEKQVQPVSQTQKNNNNLGNKEKVFGQQNNFEDKDNFGRKINNVSEVQNGNIFSVGNKEKSSSDKSVGKGNVLLISLIKFIKDTMKLKGTTEESICKFYEVNSIDELSIEQARDCMDKFKTVQTA